MRGLLLLGLLCVESVAFGYGSAVLVKAWAQKLPVEEFLQPGSYSGYRLREACVYAASIRNLAAEGKNYWREKYFFLLKNLHSFAPQTQNAELYALPTDFNLIISVRDIVPAQEDVEAYAEVFINRRSLGKTSQGLRSQKKTLKLFVDTGTRHMLQVRKYALNMQHSEWVSVRNVEQPKIKYFSVPEDRIRVIDIIYNPSYESPQHEHLKYQYKTFFLRKNQSF